MYALLDCNNFFASCERVFNPKLEGKPIVVLSNNDGCIVARSNEVKAMGVPMGAPHFKYKNMLKRFNVHVASSNFTVYGDLSKRVMDILRETSFIDTIYSVDEAFLDFTGLEEPMEHARMVRARILKWVGIPVSIGIAPTKTLAKLANEFAKKNPEYGGVISINDDGIAPLLFELPVGDVWGIGRRTAIKLNKRGVYTIAQLLQFPIRTIRSEFGVGLERVVYELTGTPCEQYTESKVERKSIIRSRSFRKKVTDKEQIREAVSSHAMTASRKLRSLGLGVQCLTIYFRTSPHAKFGRYSATANYTFPIPTNNSFLLIEAAMEMVEREYKPGFRYAKAGVVLTGLVPIDRVQTTLFDAYNPHEKSHPLFNTVDAVNKKYGNDTLRLGAMGVAQAWSMKKEWRSGRFTTEWGEILRVK